MGIFGKSQVKSHVDTGNVNYCLMNTFGTTDLDYIWQKYVAQRHKYKEENGLEYRPKNAANIEYCLMNTFGTTDLDYVFSKYMSLETRKKLENKISEQHREYAR